MGSRIVAIVIVAAGLAALAWVLLRSDDPAQVASPAETNTADVAPDAAADAAPPAATSTPGATDASLDSATATPRADPEPEPTVEAPPNFGPRMDLVDLDGWLNTDATTLSDFEGQVLLIEMWTFGCHNCKARIPYTQSYYEEFAGQFEIIGVHAPEFSYEADVANIEAALVDLGVTWPVALDTDLKNFRAWQPGRTNYWPRTYLVDQNGDIRYDHIGEGDYEELRETLRYLIEHPPATTP